MLKTRFRARFCFELFKNYLQYELKDELLGYKETHRKYLEAINKLKEPVEDTQFGREWVINRFFMEDHFPENSEYYLSFCMQRLRYKSVIHGNFYFLIICFTDIYISYVSYILYILKCKGINFSNSP